MPAWAPSRTTGPEDTPAPEPRALETAAPAPSLVVVGSATRDLDRGDPRGWRVGGPAPFAALVAGRLGIATGALIGCDPAVAEAPELGYLRAAGVDLRIVPLRHGPVFENVETTRGRLQTCHGAGEPLPARALPPEWRQAPAWYLGPVADELGEAWAAVGAASTDRALVALGWQGLLRDLVAGELTGRRHPRRSALVRRANYVGVSGGDLVQATSLAELAALLRPGATLVLTRGAHGGLAATAGPRGLRDLIWYPAVTAGDEVDPTGAGDCFLVTLLVARLLGIGPLRRMLHFAALVAGLAVGGVGLLGVPDAEAIRKRLAAPRGEG